MRKENWLGWAGGAIALALLVFVGVTSITSIQQGQEQRAIADGHRNNEIYHLEREPIPEQAAAADLQHKALEQAEDGTAFPQPLKLDFQPLAEAVDSIRKVPSSVIPERDRTRTIDFEGQTYWVYAKPDPHVPTERFIGLLSGDSVYELGTIGGDVYEKDIVVDKADVFGASYSRLRGACGANCAVERYVRLENGIPVQNLFFNYHTQLGDWNRDGINELVYSDTSIPVNTILVRFKNDRLEAVDLGVLLQAKGGVIYNRDTNAFEAYIPFNDKPVEYVYELEDMLVHRIL